MARIEDWHPICDLNASFLARPGESRCPTYCEDDFVLGPIARQHITLMLWVYTRIKFWLRMDRIDNSKTFLRQHHAHGLPMQGRWQEVADKQSCPQLFCLDRQLLCNC